MHQATLLTVTVAMVGMLKKWTRTVAKFTPTIGALIPEWGFKEELVLVELSQVPLTLRREHVLPPEASIVASVTLQQQETAMPMDWKLSKQFKNAEPQQSVIISKKRKATTPAVASKRTRTAATSESVESKATDAAVASKRTRTAATSEPAQAKATTKLQSQLARSKSEATAQRKLKEKLQTERAELKKQLKAARAKKPNSRLESQLAEKKRKLTEVERNEQRIKQQLKEKERELIEVEKNQRAFERNEQRIKEQLAQKERELTEVEQKQSAFKRNEQRFKEQLAQKERELTEVEQKQSAFKRNEQRFKEQLAQKERELTEVEEKKSAVELQYQDKVKALEDIKKKHRSDMESTKEDLAAKTLALAIATEKETIRDEMGEKLEQARDEKLSLTEKYTAKFENYLKVRLCNYFN